MAFTNFCCRAGASNLNPGTRQGTTTEPGLTADLTYSGSCSSGGVFTVSSGNPLNDGVTTNDFAAVSRTGATAWSLMGRVSAVTATQITISSGASAVNPNASVATGAGTIRIGGAMAGPAIGNAFPMDTPLNAVTDAAGDSPRLNLKSDHTYPVNVGIGLGPNYVNTIQGYALVYGDGGKATISGPTTGASFPLMSNSGSYPFWLDSLILQGNGATDTQPALSFGNNYSNVLTRCIIQDMVSTVTGVGVPFLFDQCEIFNCCKNDPTVGAISGGGSQIIVSNTIIHSNLGLGIDSTNLQANNVIVAANAGDGMIFNTADFVLLQNCDFYNNGGNAINIIGNSGARFVIRNSNFLKNGGWGIASSVPATVFLLNCGYGTGNQANFNGDIQTPGGVFESGRITYPADTTPWTVNALGDFRIVLSAAKNTGRGVFSQTAAGYSGTVAYPDVGAGRHAGVSYYAH